MGRCRRRSGNRNRSRNPNQNQSRSRRVGGSGAEEPQSKQRVRQTAGQTEPAIQWEKCCITHKLEKMQN